MEDDGQADGERAFCPLCGTPLAPWARFCPKCGNAVAPPPADMAPTRSPGVSRKVNPYREALITIGILAVAILAVGAVVQARGLPFNLGSQPVPGAGEIWFGDSFNASTFELHERWSTVQVGRPLAGVAHTTRTVEASGAKLHIDLDGATVADQLLARISGPGDLIGFTFTPPAAGTYTFSIVGLDGTVLAKGSIPAQ